MKAQTLAILGLGRTGASIGLALKQAGSGLQIVGHDGNDQVLKEAKKVGAIDGAQWKLISAVQEADILVVTTPASELQGLLRLIGSDVQAHALVLDMSSLKAKGQQWAAQYLHQGHYVGVQPIWAAGTLLDGSDGVEGARADLFRNSVYCLMPSATAEPKAVETAVKLGLLLGAKPFFIDAAEYDSLAQAVQTLPGFMAAALFRAIWNAKGWRDMARFAQAPFALATLPLQEHADLAYVALNQPETMLGWLDALMAELQELRDWVRGGEAERLTALFAQLDQERWKWLESRRENEWDESLVGGYQPPTFLEQMVGQRKKKEK